MKALSILPAVRSLVFGCAVLVAAWLALALSVGGTYAAAPSDPSDGKAPDLVGCWSLYGVPVVPGYSTVMADVDVLSANDVWTAGTQDTATGGTRPRIHHWDGSQWSIVLSPTSGPEIELDTIEAIGPDDVWAGGGTPGLFTSPFLMHWDGIDWSIVSAPTQYRIRGISAVASDDVWMVASDGGNGQVLHWDGSDWSLYDAPGGLLTIKAIASNDVWAGGALAPESELPRLWRWDGTAWSFVPLPSTGTRQVVSDIQASAPNDVWAVGSYLGSDGRYHTWVVRWDGTEWVNVASPGVAGRANYLESLAIVSPNDMWAVGYSEYGYRPLVLHWNGSQWTVVTTPQPSSGGQLMGVSAASAGDVWTVGFDDAWPQQPIVLRLTDPCTPPSPTSTGTTTPTSTPSHTATPLPTYVPIQYCWASQVLPQPPGWEASHLGTISASAPNNVWALGQFKDVANQWHPVTQRWDGAAWNIVPLPPAASTDALRDILALAPNDVWVVGSGSDRAVSYHWDGTQWSNVYVPSPGPPDYYAALWAVDGDSPNNVWVVGTYSNEYFRWPIVWRWNGTGWDSPPMPGYINWVMDVKVLSPNDVWIAGGNEVGGLWGERIAHWDGSAWTTYSRDGRFAFALEAAAPDDVWVGSSNWYFEHWNGITWSNVSSLGYSVGDISAASPSEMWAATAGGILHGNGTSWGRVPVYGPQGNLWGVEAIAPGEAWAVGQTANEETLVAHYSPGSSCTQPPTPTVGPSNTPTVTPTPLPPRCPTERFTDVCPSDYFYEPVLYLNDRNIITGYNTAPPCDGPGHIPCFKPYNGSTRGQIAKVVSLAAGFSEPVAGQTFQDVLPGSTFWEYIERMASREIIQGYTCGVVPGEPCIPPQDRPYFRPSNPVTRGQLSKMASEAFAFSEPVSGQTFEDVPPGSTFYVWVQRIASRAIIQGYPCGGQGEPCGPENKPYFRPNNHVTRGQTAKIVYLAMLEPTATPTPILTPVPTSIATGTPTHTVEPAASPTTTPTDTPVP